MTYVQTIWPVQQLTRQNIKAPPMMNQMTAKNRPAGCSAVLKPHKRIPRIRAAIRTPAATSAGLMPVITAKIVTPMVKVKRSHDA